MTKKCILVLLAAVCLIAALRWLGIGYVSSGSAVADLKEALTQLHGEPYTGRSVASGTEDMEFSIKPNTFFLTNYGLRSQLGWDYRYRCEVIYTLHQADGTTSVTKDTYVGIDPMGKEKETLRAYLEQE